MSAILTDIMFNSGEWNGSISSDANNIDLISAS